jgi:hypothetical protein
MAGQIDAPRMASLALVSSTDIQVAPFTSRRGNRWPQTRVYDER